MKDLSLKNQEKIQGLEINYMEIKKDICFIKKGQEKNEEQHKEILNRIDDTAIKIDGFIQSSTDRFVDKKNHQETLDKIETIITTLDDKYSYKWVERFLLWGGGIIGTALLLGLLALIGKVYLQLY